MSTNFRFSDLSDGELIRLIKKKKDYKAENALFDRYYNAAFMLCRRFCHDRFSTKDLCHDVLIKILMLARIGKLDPNKSIKGLIFTSARRKFLNKSRDKSKREKIIKNKYKSKIIENNYETFERKDLIENIKFLIYNLNSNDDERYLELFLEDASNEEIEDILGYKPEKSNQKRFVWRKRMQKLREGLGF